MGSDDLERGTMRVTEINRPGHMMLNPLTEIAIGMFVPVGISCSQFVMDILGYSKRRQR